MEHKISAAPTRHNQAALATNSSDRFGSVDVLRGIAIIMVVAGHANRGAMEEHIGSAAIAKWLDWFLYSLHMPIFFYLAGFFSYRSLKKTSRSQYVISRVRYIVAPYIIWSLIAVLASIIMSRLTSIRHPLSINDILNIAWKPINILWFLYAIFLFQITAAIFYSKPTYILIAATVSGCGLWLYGAAGSQELEARILNQAPFFFVGFVAAKYFKRALWAPHRQTVLIIIISLTFFAAMMSARSLGITTPVQFVTLPISAAGIFAMMILSEMIDKNLVVSGAALSVVGRASMAIYLMHVYTLALVPRLLLHLQADGAPARIMLGTLFGVAGPLLVFMLMEKLRISKYLGLR